MKRQSNQFFVLFNEGAKTSLAAAGVPLLFTTAHAENEAAIAAARGEAGLTLHRLRLRKRSARRERECRQQQGCDGHQNAATHETRHTHTR